MDMISKKDLLQIMLINLIKAKIYLCFPLVSQLLQLSILLFHVIRNCYSGCLFNLFARLVQ